MSIVTPKPVHWYHVWCGDRYHGSAWLPVAEEHFDGLRRAAFDGDVRIGLVGGLSERASAIRYLKSSCPFAEIAVQADEGFEQVTIEAMHAWAMTANPATPVYYAHTKGALQDVPMNRRWRRAMESLLTDAWQDAVTALHAYDAVGLHWLTHDQFPRYINPLRPMFGGNFWWATAGYLATLEPVEGTPERPPVTRYGAEAWLGQGFPRVLDLVPGWPDYVNEEPVALG